MTLRHPLLGPAVEKTFARLSCCQVVAPLLLRTMVCTAEDKVYASIVTCCDKYSYNENWWSSREFI
jgi:hypothetical protein